MSHLSLASMLLFVAVHLTTATEVNRISAAVAPSLSKAPSLSFASQGAVLRAERSVSVTLHPSSLDTSKRASALSSVRDANGDG